MAHDAKCNIARLCRRLGVALLVVVSPACLAQVAETVTYYYTNQQGTPLVTADAAGNTLTTSDYRPYGSQVLGATVGGPGYTGHVNDPDSGLVYMQARYYDPFLGRFLSTDPAAMDAENLHTFNRFEYASNNPVGNIDTDGKVVTSLNASNNATLAGYINQYASGQYAFNGGNLQRVGPGTGSSSYYASKLDALIASPDTLVLDISSTYTTNTGSVVQVQDFGGGLTQRRVTGDVFTVVDGNGSSSIDSDGNYMSVTPAEVFLHEIVGHAAPYLVGSDTGNAVSNENKARAQIPGLKQRAADPSHTERPQKSPPKKPVPPEGCGILCSH
jgi:RHS repeat-associated protein